jgi:HEAT repeat protein
MTWNLLITAVLSVLPLVAQPEKTAWNVLTEGFEDKDPDKRRQAVTATGSIGLMPEAVRLVEEALHDKDPIVRQTAAAELAEMKSTGSIPALKAEIDDPSAAVAFAAAKALLDLGDRSGKNVVEDVLEGEEKTSNVVSDTKEDIRKKMRDPKTLALMGFNAATGALLGPYSTGIILAEKALQDGTAGSRALAADLLGKNCDARSLQLLERSFRKDKNWAVKAAAAKGMGECGNSDSIPNLEQALSDSHAAVKDMSAAAIIRISITSSENVANARLNPSRP